MKKILAIIISLFIVFSCGIFAPTWTEIGQEGTYIEYCNDTLAVEQLDSTLNSHNINVTFDKWSLMKFYSPDKEELIQFTYTKSDTIYVITKDNDKYIFTAKCLNKLDK